MKAIRTIGLLVLLLITGSCGPMINIMEVDVRLPATRPLNIMGRNMAVFTPQYDSVTLTDSVLLNRFAQAFADGLASQASLPKGSVPLFSHYCGSEPLGTLEQPDYVLRLALDTGADLVFMVDSVTIGDFQIEDPYLITPVLSVVRVYDAESVRFTQYIPISDTVAWEFWMPDDEETIVIPKNAFVDLQKAAVYLGERTSRSFLDQWETQDRVVFVYDKRAWNRAYDHALNFEWDKAMEIWLELLEGTNAKEVACAAFNLALACEMQGHFELAEKWLELSRKTYNMPETSYYLELLKDRNKQKMLF